MNKFKVGDKVKVVVPYFDSFPVGSEGVITKSYEDTLVSYDVDDEHGVSWPVCEGELELVS